MAKDSYCEISEYFAIYTVEQLISLKIVMIDLSIDRLIGVKKICMPSTDYVV